MATKTISLKIEAWDRLRRARQTPDESFSDVVMRAQWPEVGATASELLAVYSSRGPHFSLKALDRIRSADPDDKPSEGLWDQD